MVALLSGILSPTLVSAQQIVLRAADNQPPDYPTVQGLVFMANYLEAASGGRIRMEVYPGGQLGDERSTIEQVQLGVIDIVRTSTSPVGEFYAPMGVYSLPYIFRNETHMWKVVQGPIGRQLLDGLKGSGLVGLAYYDSGSRSFYTNKKPIRDVADLEGLRIRTQQSRVVLDMMEALGARPVPMAYEEVYSALQTGAIDGAENNFPSYGPRGVRHYEVAPYFSLDQHARVPEIVMISLQTWNRLSREDQDLIREAALASVPVQAALWRDLVAESRRAVEAAGSEIIDVNVEEFQAAMGPLYEKYGKAYGDLLQRILDTK
ncbi:TRAP transporter substrate-binding protein [Limnochorda pilosa]|uniref:TRAP transporter substrate-binding protein n=1 Tax=Limnochorda pilosa TaxID=1555112 RepID=UPI0022B1CA53|nr:TRAP transporter substrate-binding protein [Limnochorda pilosa]